MSLEEKLKETKAEIRSLVVSSPVGLTIPKLIKEYVERLGKNLPYQEFGYKYVNDFLSSLTDVIQFEHTNRGPVLVPVWNEQIAHIHDLVQKQKKQKSFNFFRPLQKPEMIISQAIDVLQQNTSHAPYYEINEGTIKPLEQIETQVDCEKVTMQDTSISEVQTSSEIQTKNIEDAYKTKDPLNLSNCSTANDTLPVRNNSPVESIYGESISDQMKDNFRQILQLYSKGISANKFSAVYKEKFGCPLVVQDFGFSSMKELIISLPNIFTFEKTKYSQDWVLHDARISPKRKDSSSKWIPNIVLDSIIDLTAKYPQGIKSEDILNKYEDEYKVRIDIKKLGFENIGSFLANCSSIQLKIIDEECIIFPKAKAKIQDVESSDSVNALPPLEHMKHLWKTYFTDEVCDPTYDYKKFQLSKVTQMRVSVSDIHSPSAIWLQPLENATRLNNLMYALNLFYDDLEENYSMHENVLKPGQVCCVRFHLDNRWYRSKILEVKDKDKIKVCYVDYGTINWEKHHSLRLLHKKFIDDPIHVIRAKFHNLQPKNKNEWGNDVNYFLFELLYQKTFYAVIMEVEKSIPIISVMLIDTSQADDININDILIQKEFARCSAISSVDKDNEEVDFQNREVYQKDKFLEISNLLAGILQKILPGWLTLGAPMDGEGVRSLFKEIEENADGTITNKQLNLCCSSHFIRSLFLTDVENISRIWHNIILKNIVYIYQEFLKDVTSVVPMEERYFHMHPFCEKYSSEFFSSTLLKNESVLQSASPPNRNQELKEADIYTEGFSDNGTWINMKTNELTLTEGHQMANNGDCSETCQSVKSRRKYGYDFYPEFPSRKDSCASSTITSRNLSDNKSGVVCPLQCERDEKKFVFEAELDDGRTLLLVQLVNQTYVVQEQILRDFTTGIPTMLLKHRANKFTDQTENIFITPDTHPGIFRSLKGCGIMRNSQGTLMPLGNVGKFLRIVSPQDKYLPAVFD